VTNNGNVDLNNVTVTDPLINNLAKPVNDTVLNVGETWTYTGNYNVTQEDLNSNGTLGDGFITNNATVDCDELGPQNDIVQVPLKRSPNYSIFKAVIAPDDSGDCIVNSPGDEIPYRIIVKNEGNVVLTNVSVNDSKINFTEQIGVLNPGDVWNSSNSSKAGNIIYKLTRDDINSGNGNVTNNATVSCNELPDKSSSVDTPIAEKTDLSIYKSTVGIDKAGDGIINQPGDIINYQIAVKNYGNKYLTNVTVSDPKINLAEHIEVLSPGELCVYRGDYKVTQEDISSNGNGNGYIENTAKVSCNELSDKISSIKEPIIIPKPPELPGVTSVLPVANFSASPTSGTAPLSVQFTDSSQNAVSRSWDFNNDGTIDSSEVKPVYKYTTPGTYNAKLTASNANGTNIASKTITVLPETIIDNGGSSGGSSHRSSGSGGAVLSSSTVNPKTNGTGNATVTQAQNTTPVEQNNENTAETVEQTSEQKNNTSTPAKESKGTPGFETILGITGLLAAVFIFRRK
jgi:PKD repeat protein